MYKTLILSAIGLITVGMFKFNPYVVVTKDTHHIVNIVLMLLFGAIAIVTLFGYSKQYKQVRVLTSLSMTDELTNIHNRRSVFIRANEEINKSLRTNAEFSVAVFDIDHFKQVNDNYGHDFGDNVLRNLATLFEHEMRDGDVVGRLGGDEFTVLLTNTNANEAEFVLNRIAGLLRDFNHDGIHVTISVGVSTLRRGENFIQLLKRADNALYVAKHKGRDCVVVDTDPLLECCTS